jgi:hypothetical protein
MVFYRRFPVPESVEGYSQEPWVLQFGYEASSGINVSRFLLPIERTWLFPSRYILKVL